MATTNSYNFVMTRDNIITDALLHIGAIGEGETPSANAVTEAARVLNMLAKLRSAASGMPLWAIKRGVILPVTDTNSVTTISHIVQADSYVETAVGADEAAAQTDITVDSITGISNGDAIGVELDDGTMQWTTVNGVPSGTTVVLTAALTSAASDGNKIYAYTASSDRISRPLRVYSATVKETTNDISWEIDIEDREDFWKITNVTTESVPTMLYYEPGLGSAVADPATATTWYGTFNFWPRFNGGDHVIEFTYQRPSQDFDAAGDHPDFPQEFYLPLVLELAALLGPRYGVEPSERARLFTEAAMYLEEALVSITSEGSMTLQPDTTRG